MRIPWQVFASPCLYLGKLIKNRRGMQLMHDGATSYTEHMTLNVLQAHRVKFALARPYSNEHIWDVIDRVPRRRALSI